jgi:HK97 family phage portal protein
MRIFGFNITRQKAGPPVPVAENRGGWFPLIRESYTGAWQQNFTVDRNLVLSYNAVFACMTLIASDVSKLRLKLVEMDSGGVWSEAESPAYSPVLRRPNPFQTRNQFFETWMLSKLSRGNTYVLKGREGRGVVNRLYILDPNRVKTLMADDGSVFYALSADNVAGLTEDIMVPASEIIHDRFNTLFHQHIGVSPIFAAGVPATRGNNITNNSAAFFANRSQPGGMLSAPGHISSETAARLKETWDSNFTGENYGKIAVAGDGLKFEQFALSAADSQLIEQLQWTATEVCSCFHVPPYKIGIGPMPTYNNIQALNVEYYSTCLQKLLEDAEACLDDGLGIGPGVKVEGRTLGVEFDVDGLLRMDSVTQMDVLEKASGVMTIDEKRRKLDLKKTKGGEAVYLQQQNYSLAALAKRDAKEDPFGTAKPAPAAAPVNDNRDEMEAAAAVIEVMKGLR